MPVELTSIYSGGLTSHAANSESWRAASNVVNGSAPSAPAAPPPPDYASANRAGIITDVATLGKRKEVENAALFGGNVMNYGVEEKTRMVTKDGFIKNNKGQYFAVGPNGKASGPAVPESQAAVSQTYYTQSFGDDGKRLKTPKEISSTEAFQKFDDSNSTIAATEKLSAWQREQRDVEAQSLYDLGKKYGDQYINMAKDFMEKLDPEGTANRKQLAADVAKKMEEYGGSGPAIRDITDAIANEKIKDGPVLSNMGQARRYREIGEAGKSERVADGASMERAGNADTMERVSDVGDMEKISGKGPQFARGQLEDGGGQTQGIRSRLEQDIMDNLMAGDALTGSQERSIERNIRSAQVKRGNYSGPAASAAEIASKYDFGTRMGQQRRAEALGMLSSGQTSFDVASRLRQEGNTLSQQELQNELSNIAQRNTASQSDLANRLSTTQQRNLAEQSDFENMMSSTEQRNRANQSDISNKLATTTQRNQASQIDYDNLMNQISQNNLAGQRDFENDMASTQFNNSNAQQTFANNLAAISQRNTANQQDYANRMAQTQFNNQNQQQRMANELTAIGQRNSVAQQGVANRMSFAGLQPVGALASATAGAAAMPIPNTPSAQLMNLLNINPNAGSDAAKFALGVFDTQSRNYQSQLNYNASTYANNNPMGWVKAVGGLNPFSFNMGV